MMQDQEESSIFKNMYMPEPVWKRTTILGTLFFSQVIYILFTVLAVATQVLDHGLDLRHSLFLLLAIVHVALWVISLIKRGAFGFIIAAMQYSIGVIIIASSFVTTWNRSGVLVPSIILLAVSLIDLVILNMPIVQRFYGLKQPTKLATKYALAVVFAMASVGLLLGISYL